MTDIASEIDAIQREVAPGAVAPDAARTIRLRRTYDAPIADVWDALTNPDRIGRWFLPVSGDYRLGGRFQFEGNAGGEIVACERPNRLAVTWGYAEMGGDATASQLVLRLAPDGDEATVFELEHTAVVPDDMWAEYGPGAVGVGWDQGLLGLARHLRGESTAASAWEASPDGQQFALRSNEAWGAANQAAGVDAATVARNVANTKAFYVPSPDASS